jgi:ribonuclease R
VPTTQKQKQRKVRGILTVNARGFGFVNLDDEPDLFIQLEHLGTALHGDTVEALVFSSSRKNRPAGKITKVVERAERSIVGIYRAREEDAVVHPEDQRLPEVLEVAVKKSDRDVMNSLRSGHVVVAELVTWTDRAQPPLVRITKILGDQDDPGMDLKIIAVSNGLSLEFSEEALGEAQGIKKPEMRKEAKRRWDLRSVPCFTIDPKEARDLDDALSVRQLQSGLFEVGVHIADVSYFVQPGGALDKEARSRATSVYFVDEVLPMLPERLSADLCSLQPGKDRLTYSVVVQLDSLGAIHNVEIGESVIKSRHKFSYEEAQRVLRGGSHEHADSLHLLQLISRTLRHVRTGKGSIDFDVGEKLITVDKDGVPRTVRPKERLEAHRLVEEMMLLANRSIAEWIMQGSTGAERGKQSGNDKRAGRENRSGGDGRASPDAGSGPGGASGQESLPFLFRNHERPRQEDMEAFVAALSNLGIPYKAGDPVTAEDYRNILELIQNLEFKDFIEKIALMSMTRAEYHTENRGHFALAFDAYTHFTSPIRRYADLTVHRLLKQLHGGRRRRGGRGKPKLPSRTELQTICNECNEKSRVAEGAEREYIKMKSMEFLSRRVGNVYEGIISGVTSFGLFVELTRYLIEGLVPLSSLTDDYYSFDEENYRHVGKNSGTVYRLGDRVEVRVKSVSVEERKAVFAIV